MVSPFNFVKVCSNYPTGSSMASSLQCQSVTYVAFYRRQIYIGVRFSCLVKKVRLEPTPKMLNYRPEICCAKNKVLFETKTLTLFVYHKFFQHLLYHIQQSTLISWNYFVNNILQYVRHKWRSSPFLFTRKLIFT